jgi:neutral ceramidase
MNQSCFCVAVLLAAAAVNSSGADLQIATAAIEITGPIGYPMGGYGARKEVSWGIHDPLLAKVLLIKSNSQQFGIVTFDLVLMASPRLAHEARAQLGISPLLQIASHTHSGPIPKNMRSIEEDPWYRAMEDKVLAALKQAQSQYQPAQLSAIDGSVYIGHNRRKVNPDGKVTMFWRNADRMPTSPVDPHLGILRFSRTDGSVLAVLVNYACHAVVLGPDNLDYSADWPGYMYRDLEKQLGGKAMAYFIPGAGGDINPYDDKQPLTQDAFGVARKTGETVSAAVVRAMRSKPAPTEEFELQTSQETYDFHDRFQSDSRVPTQVTRVLLSKDIGILAMPAEPFVLHQLNFRDRSPLKHTYMFGYAFGGEGKFTGYVPTIKAAMEGGYGASYATRVEVGAGERMVDRALIWFYERLGKLRDVPDKP